MFTVHCTLFLVIQSFLTLRGRRQKSPASLSVLACQWREYDTTNGQGMRSDIRLPGIKVWGLDSTCASHHTADRHEGREDVMYERHPTGLPLTIVSALHYSCCANTFQQSSLRLTGAVITLLNTRDVWPRFS